MIAKKPTLATLKRRAEADTPPPAAESIVDVPAFEEESSPARFTPPPVKNIKSTGLAESLIESLVFKSLHAEGAMTGRALATTVGMPAKPIIDMLAQLKSRQFVHYKDSTAMGDFEYALTDAGRQRALSYIEESSYVGPAPVTLEAYIKSVEAQSITKVQPQAEDLKRAFSDLLINEDMFARLGPAINSGRGLFLYGYPGNGKTSIAERITSCFGDDIWIPYAIHAGGEIVTFFDAQCHDPADDDVPNLVKDQSIDARWVKIKRPTIVAGGELTMEALDLCYNHQTKITEPSLQLKSNTGTLVIDDFGRQRMRPIELLNRWIVPLEKRYDFLNLASGKKIKVPFDQLIIFSTNLEPKDLVDEAFLRRIPYKINVIDPTEEEFRKLFDIMGSVVDVQVTQVGVDHVIEKHYKAVDRPFRCCQPRDLLLQIRNFSAYAGKTPIADPESFDAACGNYFAVM